MNGLAILATALMVLLAAMDASAPGVLFAVVRAAAHVAWAVRTELNDRLASLIEEANTIASV